MVESRAQFSNAAHSRLRAELEQLAQLHKISIRPNDAGALCLATQIGHVCILAVPHRSEFEVWLNHRREGGQFRYPLFSLQEALGLKPHAIMFSDATLDGAISVLVDQLGALLAATESNPDLLGDIDDAYRRAIDGTALSTKKRKAERLWSAGQFAEAAQIYEGLPDLSAVEAKRLGMIKAGKTPR